MCDDQIQTNPFWRESFRQRRCLVPAGAFCEPNGDVKPATWHWFALKGDDNRPLFAFPGIWRRYKREEGEGPNADIEAYAFLTTTPNTLVGAINNERTMPFLLMREDEFETWLGAWPANELHATQLQKKSSRICSE